MLLEPFAICLADPVEDDGDADDGKAVENAQREVLVGDRFQHRLAKALDADHRGDDHHGECHHDRLVDAGP